MSEKNPYNPISIKHLFSCKPIRVGLLVCSIILSSFHVKAVDAVIEINLNPIISFDDVPVDFIVNGYLRFETNVIITESNNVYINLEDLFRNLGIKCVSENEGNYLTGFIENESQSYSIDFSNKQITIGNKTIKSVNGIIKESGAIYVESTVITAAFGFGIVFNYRSLSIKMEADFELPLIKQMRLERMRKNVSKLQDKQVIADTIIKRDYHLLKFGMMDWSLASFQTKDEVTNNRVVIGVGAELLYGQANVSVYYDDEYKFDKRQLYYNWRWVDNNKSAIRQAQLGKIYNKSISFLEAPVVGAAISNTPTTIRKASGSYTISEYTEPNWSVELYINDVLIDYTVADASGLFVFKVPIVYGYTTIKLKFYGPMGEERIEERTKNVPFTFMPANTLEYSVSGGVLQDDTGSRFGKGTINYGINRLITLGGGLEYLSSIPDYPFIPFATLAFQPFNKMVLNFEYAHNVKMQGLLNYYFGKSAFLEIDYADFTDGQMATRFNANEELKVRLSLPYKTNKVSGYTKLNYNQFVYNAFKFNQFDATFSGYYKNYSANLSTLVNWVSENIPYITSNLALSYKMKNGLVFRPLVEYNISNSEFLRYKAEIEKRVAKAYFSVSYERNVAYKTDNVFVSFRYDLPFARTGISVSHNNNNFIIAENAQGSLAFGGNKTVISGNNSSLGKGGILFYPFLDLNQNGVFDKDEQMILLSSVKVSGGRAVISEKDSIVRISDLNAFVDYTVEFSNNDLENISWRFKHKTYQVLVDPNQYKRVYVPILSLGEISGMVNLNNNNLDGIGRITIEIFDKQGKKVAETLSESDGYFSYLGLEPGSYTVSIDEKQMGNLEYQSKPLQQKVVIEASVDGDIIDGLDFVLNSKETGTNGLSASSTTSKKANTFYLGEIRTEADPIVNEIVTDNSNDSSDSVTDSQQNILERSSDISPVDANQNDVYIIETPNKINAEHNLVWGRTCDKPGYYYVQCGAFKVKSNAMRLALSIKQTTGLAAGVVLTDNFYKVQVGCLSTKAEANGFKVQLMKKLAINGIFIQARHYSNNTINSALKSQTVSDSLKAFTIDTLNIQSDKNIIVWGEICDKPGYYYVQSGAFNVKDNAMPFALSIKQTTGLAVGIVLADGFYKVQVGCLPTRIKAKETKSKIEADGLFENSFYKKRE